jgi:hypothetical protein
MDSRIDGLMVLEPGNGGMVRELGTLPFVDRI